MDYAKTTYANTIPDPEDISEGEIIISKNTGGEPYLASLMCPCGCQEFIQLGLKRRQSPKWEATVADGLVTLSPSVNLLQGCKSHFFVQDGKVRWC